MEAAIQTCELSKRYGDRLALDRLSLEVPPGSLFGFLGPNGAGKTTTLKILAGLRRPTRGDAFLMGHSLRREPMRVRALCGYLPEAPSFYGWMTAREYLAFAAQLSGVSTERLRERLDFLLEIAGLRKTREPICTFSRGMRQRLGIAQALIHDPPVLLLDEPTSALDPVGRHEVLETLRSLRGGVTIFFSSHILGDVERVVDRVAILQAGRLVVQERIDDLRRRTLRRTVRLEVEGDPAELLVKLRREPWLIDAQREETGLTLRINDLLAAENQIPALLAENKVPLRRWEISEPTLEEIFLETLAEESS